MPAVRMNARDKGLWRMVAFTIKSVGRSERGMAYEITHRYPPLLLWDDNYARD